MDEITRRPLSDVGQLQQILVTVLDRIAATGSEVAYRLVGTSAAGTPMFKSPLTSE